MNDASTWIHPFERANLGLAPFRCLGYQELVYTYPDGTTKAGGSCDYCGTSIRHSYQIQGSRASDKAFKVGCDCVARTSDTELAEAARKARKASERAARDSEYRAARKALQDAAEARRMAQAERNAEDGALLIFALQAVTECDRVSEYTRNRLSYALSDIVTGGRDGAYIVGLEITLACEAWRTLTAPESKAYGEPGQRVKGEIRATFEGGPIFDTQYGAKILARFRLDSGEILVWGTSPSSLPDALFDTTSAGFRKVKRGERCTLLAFTVKGHKDYKGEAQTEIQRAKIAE